VRELELPELLPELPPDELLLPLLLLRLYELLEPDELLPDELLLLLLYELLLLDDEEELLCRVVVELLLLLDDEVLLCRYALFRVLVELLELFVLAGVALVLV
jgi:hypothetical protein